MRKLIPLLAAAAAIGALACAGVASAATIGVNEDETKTDTSLYDGMADVGLRQNVLSVIWTQGQGLSGGQQSTIRNAISVAAAKGIKIVLAIYDSNAPGNPSKFADPSNHDEFIAFVTNAVRSFPQADEEIEEVAARDAGAIARLHADPLLGYEPFEGRRLVDEAEIDDPGEQAQVLDIVEKLYRCFATEEAMLCEINPLIVTPSGEVKALDAKVTIDDSALYRHPDLAAMRDPAAADPLETLAREKHITYVKLDGSVAIVGNGAGLAMSTVDLIVFAGGRPANFCDLGGASNADTVTNALEVIAADTQVRSILFNIFAGITRCDEIARGMLVALDRTHIASPIVVRFDGTNADAGRQILADSGRPNIFFEPTMLDAARRAVEVAA